MVFDIPVPTAPVADVGVYMHGQHEPIKDGGMGIFRISFQENSLQYSDIK